MERYMHIQSSYTKVNHTVLVSLLNAEKKWCRHPIGLEPSSVPKPCDHNLCLFGMGSGHQNSPVDV